MLLTHVSSLTLSEIETMDSGWISPQYEVSSEILLDIADYGSTIGCDQDSYVGSHLAFIKINNEEKWRVVVVYLDKIVMFQEDSDPRTVKYSFPVDNIDFSESGRYVVLSPPQDENRNYREAIRVDMEQLETVPFDAAIEGPFESGTFYVLDSGAICFAKWLDWNDYNLRYYFYSSDLSDYFYYNAEYPRFLAVSESFFLLKDADGLHCFNDRGILWEHSNSFLVSDPTLTDEACLLPLTDGISIVKTLTGIEIAKISEIESSEVSGVLLQSDEDEIVILAKNVVSSFLGNIPIVSCDFSISFYNIESGMIRTLDFPVLSETVPILRQATNNSVLLQIRNRVEHSSVFVVIDSNGNPYFVSFDSSSGINGSDNFNGQKYFQLLSSTENRLLSINLNTVMLYNMRRL